MIFTNMFYKNHRSPLSKMRQHNGLPTASPDWSGDEYADLLSRDKSKMKEAIKRYLSSRVRNDWTFTWPPPASPSKTAAADSLPTTESLGQSNQASPAAGTHSQVQDEPGDDAGYQVDSDSDSDSDDTDPIAADNDNDDDAQSIYSVVSLDPSQYQIRTDWDSDFPADEPMPYGHSRSTSGGLPDPTLSKEQQRAVNRREMRKEMEWNEGLACFEARRNAWTEARVVRVRHKQEAPQTVPSPRSRRFFFRRSISSTGSSQGSRSRAGSASLASDSSPTREADKELYKQNDKSSTSSASASSVATSYPVETIIPTAPPLLPPNNTLRASINSSNYLQLYDKLIINNLQPSCPVNLSDMIGACVAGWKRDGEWPVRPVAPPPTSTFTTYTVTRTKRSSIVVGNETRVTSHNHSNSNSNSAASPTSPTSGRRVSLTGFLAPHKDVDYNRSGKGMRHSIQKVFGMGSPPLSHHMSAAPPLAPEKAVQC